MGDDTDMGEITERSKCGGDRKVGSVIPPLLLTSFALDKYKDINDDNDGYILDNNYFLNHN